MENEKENRVVKEVMFRNTTGYRVRVWDASSGRFTAFNIDESPYPPISVNNWKRIGTQSFYVNVSFVSPDDTTVRVMTGWWDNIWRDVTIYDSDIVTKEDDGTYTIKIDFLGYSIANEYYYKDIDFLITSGGDLTINEMWLYRDMTLEDGSLNEAVDMFEDSVGHIRKGYADGASMATLRSDMLRFVSGQNILDTWCDGTDMTSNPFSKVERQEYEGSDGAFDTELGVSLYNVNEAMSKNDKDTARKVMVCATVRRKEFDHWFNENV